jgi:hypothetical protein
VLDNAEQALKKYEKAVYTLLRCPTDAAAKSSREAALAVLRACDLTASPPTAIASSELAPLLEGLCDAAAQFAELAKFSATWDRLRFAGVGQVREYPSQAQLDAVSQKLSEWQSSPLRRLDAAIQRQGRKAASSFTSAVLVLQDWLSQLLAGSAADKLGKDAAVVRASLAASLDQAVLDLGHLLVWDCGKLRKEVVACLDGFPLAELGRTIQATFAAHSAISPSWAEYQRRAPGLRSAIGPIEQAAQRAEGMAAAFAASNAKLLLLQKRRLEQEHQILQLELEQNSLLTSQETAVAAALQDALAEARQELVRVNTDIQSAKDEYSAFGDDIFSVVMVHYPELFTHWVKMLRLDRVFSLEATGVGLDMLSAVGVLEKYTLRQQQTRYGRPLIVALNPSNLPCQLVQFKFSEGGALARFQRLCFTKEVELLQQLKHPFVESVAASFLDLQSASAYMEVPLYAFASLREWLLHSSGELKARAGSAGLTHGAHLNSLKRISACVAQALAYLERASLAHGNVSPGSVAVRKDGTAVLTSFGTSIAEECRALPTGQLNAATLGLARDGGFAAPEILH